jgi:CheY-like chemotaxis protein
MNDLTLADCHVLLVEDEFLIAHSLSQLLQNEGATIVGPVATSQGALRMLGRNERVDAAVLDVNLHGQTSYSVADALLARSVPIVFTTGYLASMIPPRYRGIDVLQKPFRISDMLRVLTGLIHHAGTVA